MRAGTLLPLVVSVLTDTISIVSVFFRICGSSSLMCFISFFSLRSGLSRGYCCELTRACEERVRASGELVLPGLRPVWFA